MLELFNILTILLILHVALNMLGLKGSGILSCGLFSYLGARDNHSFNWDKFNALGLDNDERGGDSVGRAVGDDIRKFINKKKAQTTYKDYVINHKNGPGHHIAIGHTRKASVGVISEDTAQPVVIDIPGGGKFIMVHNGTLFNWEDLATKYNIVKTGKSDSMVLGEIIFQYGYDVLKEYEGAAALIIRDDRNPDTVMVFRGKSKVYSGKVEDERPLYYMIESANSLYISSREEGLYFIGGDIDTVEEFEANRLYCITNGRIISTLDYDRSECSQVKVWKAPAKTTTFASPYSTSRVLRTINDNSDEYAGYSERRTYVIRKDYMYKPTEIEQIVPARLRYYFYEKDGVVAKYANGMIVLSESGIRSMTARKAGEKIYYFYSGIMLKDRTAHSEVLRIFGKSKKFIDTDENIRKICKYAAHPVCTVDHDIPIYSNVYSWQEKYNVAEKKLMPMAVYFTGKFTPLFSKKTYEFTTGDNSNIEHNSFMLRGVHAEPAETKVIALPQFSGMKPKPITPEYMPKWVAKYCSDIDDEDEDDTLADNYSMSDVFYDTEANPDDLDIPEDIAGVDIFNEYAVKALEDGLQSMLMALDETVDNIETTGMNGKLIARILSNLYSLQDALLEKDKFKKNNLVATYDEF